MRHAHLRLVASVLLTLSLLVTACSEGVAPVGPDPLTDGGTPVDGGGDEPLPDGGSPRIVWPEATHVVEGAREAGLALSPDGHVTLAYALDGTVYAHRDPPAGEPVAVGEASQTFEQLLVLSSPTEDRIFMAWTSRWGAVLTGGVPAGPRLRLWQGDTDLYTLGGGWVDGQPVLVARSTEVTYTNGQSISGKHLAFTVPIDTPEELPLPEPRDADALALDPNPFHHSDESETVLDLGDGVGLMFDRWTENPPDDDTVRDRARWRILGRSPTATGPRANYLVDRSGTIVLPAAPASWIRAFALGEGRYVLAWAAGSGTLVYDVFLAGFELDDTGAPQLTTDALNLSFTTGLTDNSDFPIVLPVGDGRFWVAWRETAYGPRVALMSEDLRILALGNPATELGCNMGSPMGAAVDEEGTLHLAGAFVQDVNDVGVPSVRYFRIALP